MGAWKLLDMQEITQIVTDDLTGMNILESTGSLQRNMEKEKRRRGSRRGEGGWDGGKERGREGGREEAKEIGRQDKMTKQMNVKTE